MLMFNGDTWPRNDSTLVATGKQVGKGTAEKKTLIFFTIYYY